MTLQGAVMSRVDVLMPQMGESIAEGTLSKWLKKLGDPVKRDEPLFEISTDKVDAEIPAPSAGTLVEIKVQEGQTVPVDRKSTRLNSSHANISYAVFCLKKKKKKISMTILILTKML